MSKILFIDFEKCTGCRICEMYCSFTKTKTCNPARSRVRVIKWEEEGINVPTVCQECEDAPCKMVCPVNAISRDQESGLVSIDQETCISCKMCLLVCPFGAISMDPVDGKVFKCDLCDGDPWCARTCPTEAIRYISADKASLAKKREGMEKVTNLMRAALAPGQGSD
ncbi:4Fe-4S dicluster domain-containing protein [Chloroflexota bacterium]